MIERKHHINERLSVLKFRAFHLLKRIMFYPEEMSLDDMTLTVNGKGLANVSGIDPKFSQYYGEILIPMMFTGRTDSIGRELYEGDILMVPNKEYKYLQACNWNENEDGFYEIVWNHENSAFYAKDLRMPNGNGVYLWVLLSAMNNCRIIGDIYTAQNN